MEQRYGPTHSGSMEGIFFGLPNLDIFIPNLYIHYSNILNRFKETKTPMLVIETKSNYTKNMKPSIYIEYKESTEEFITTIEPKERKIKPKNYASNFDMNRKEPWTH